MKKKILSALLSMSMILTMSGISVMAGSMQETREASEQAETEENVLRLWYDEPASASGLSGNNLWEQMTLPIGNSFMGANVYGEIVNERLTFNQKTLWNGGPSESRPNYQGGNIATSGGVAMSEKYRQVVEAFRNNASNATSLCNALVGAGLNDGYGAYQSWGDIYLTFSGLTNDNYTDYSRDLDLATGIANVDFTQNGTDYHREYFMSYPDNVLAMKLTAKGNSKLNLNVKFPVDNDDNNVVSRRLGKNADYTVDASAGTIVMKGSLQDNQMKMNSVLQVVTDGTKAAGSDQQSLDISGADEVVIFISAGTDYKNTFYNEDKTKTYYYRTGETDEQVAARVKGVVDAAKEKGYDEVKSSHLADYQELFARVDLNLGQTVQAAEKTTDDLLAAYKNSTATSAERGLLEVLLYQYGRYLTIASSREGDLPSNLQGVWQNRVGDGGQVPWGSDYHINVNLQMNYMPTYSANLVECATPLVDYIESMVEPGKVTAQTYFGTTDGFAAHTQNNPFGWTCPGWSFDWGWSPASVPWILQNCWEYYEYTGDLEYMKEKLYPMMKEEALLYDQILVDSGTEITLEDGTKSTRLVTAPAYSPEHGARTLGNTYEGTLVWQLYEDTIKAAELLGVDEDEVARWKENQSRLSPIEIGKSGQIKEWYIEEEFNKDADGNRIGEGYGHRHISHMLGLYPGDLITEEHPEWMAAAKVSMENRTDDSTGWGMAQRIATWARLGDGNHAYKVIGNLLGSKIYKNLWDTHPPFQIDGNFGYTAGVNELLMQSNMGYINLLPALPDAWRSGHAYGLLARGNFEVDMEWSDNQMDRVMITSKSGGEVAVQGNNYFLASVTDEDGNEVEITKIADNRISFDTEKGKSYTISQIPKENKGITPTGLNAGRLDANRVELSWNAGENNEDMVYNVYRQADEGEMVQIASGVTGTRYTDETGYSIFGSLTYQVTAGSGKAESEPSESVSLNSGGMIDDQDSRIQYSGNWGDWNSESSNYDGTIKYLESPTGTETATLTFTGTGIGVWTCLNSDRGKIEVSIDGTSYGEYDTYAASTTRQHEVFLKTDLAPGEHTIVVRATNTKGNGSKTKVELDAFRVISPSGIPEIPEEQQAQVLAVESERVMIQWTPTDGADSYKIYANGREAATATGTYTWVEGLESGKEYTLSVKAVVSGQESQNAIEVKATTLSQETKEPDEGTAPDKVTGLTVTAGADATQAKLSWKASNGAAKYKVYVDGALAGETADTEYALTGLTVDQKYNIKVVAVSEQDKNSDVARLSFVAGKIAASTKKITSVAAFNGVTAKNGTAFEQLTLPKKAKVVLDSGEIVELDVTWQKSNYNGSTAGTYTLQGDLRLAENIENPQNKKASIAVTVEKAGQPPVTQPKKGDVIKAKDGSRYQVINPDTRTAKLVAVKSKNATKMNVPATVDLNGYKHTVTQVGDKVMSGNAKLKKVILGKNVTSIGKSAFKGCKSLTMVQLKGKALKTIGKQAFKKTSAKLVVSAKKMNKKQKAALLKKLKKAGAGKKTRVK